MPLYDLKCPDCHSITESVFLTFKQFDRGHKCRCGARMRTLILRPPNVQNYVKELYVPGTNGRKIELHSKGKVYDQLRRWGQYAPEDGVDPQGCPGVALQRKVSAEKAKEARWKRYDQIAQKVGLDIPWS